jgi:hypothetical protein
MTTLYVSVPMELTPIIAEILDEYDKATRRFGPFASAHEGWAVIREEVDELWKEVKNNKRPPAQYQRKMDKEAMQVAAMAIRFMHDVSRKEAT